MLSDLDIKKEYRNLQCDVVNDFYIPILRKAVIYIAITIKIYLITFQ